MHWWTWFPAPWSDSTRTVWEIDGAWGWIMGIMMLLWMALPLILIAIGIYLLLRVSPGRSGQVQSPSPPSRPTSTALAILAERYARGEISTEEYRARRAELEAADRGEDRGDRS